MTDVKSEQSVRKLASPRAQKSETEFERLQQLILGPDYSSTLRTLIGQTETDRVAAVVTEALQRRSQKDASLTQVIAPAVSDSLDQAIRDNPQRITNVIYPIIGPAIRKSVASALAEMMQNLNDVLSQSLSLRAWWWRVQAWRAGMSYGEFVLLKTLQFRVHQVLLIHRETGLLIAEASSDTSSSEDPELISSMLTAISDFVADSFRKQDASINSIGFGEHTLQVIVGPMAVLVARVQGTVTTGLIEYLSETLEEIHQRALTALEYFDGDKTSFAEIAPLLKAGLQVKAKEKIRRRPWLAYTLVAFLILWIGAWLAMWWQAEQRKDAILQRLEQQPDYVLINHSQAGDLLHITLLRDPETPAPESLLAGMDIAPWQLHFETHTADLRPIVKAADPEPTTSQRWRELTGTIQSTRLYFNVNSDQLAAGEDVKIPLLIAQLNSLQGLAKELEIKQYQIVITGYADASGDDNANAQISRKRAQAIASLLSGNGIKESLITVWGVGHLNTLDLPAADQRIVTFQILSSGPPT